MSNGGGWLCFFPTAIEPAVRELYAWMFHHDGESVARDLNVIPVTQDGTTPWGGLVNFSKRKLGWPTLAKAFVDINIPTAVDGGAAFLIAGQQPSALTPEWDAPLDDALILASYQDYVLWEPYTDATRTTLKDPVPPPNLLGMTAVQTREGKRGEVATLLQAAGLDFMPQADAA